MDHRAINKFIQDKRAMYHKMQIAYPEFKEVFEWIWPVLAELEKAMKSGDEDARHFHQNNLNEILELIVPNQGNSKAIASLLPTKRLKTFAEQKHYIDPACWEIAERENWQVDEPPYNNTHPLDKV